MNNQTGGFGFGSGQRRLGLEIELCVERQSLHLTGRQKAVNKVNGTFL